MKYVVVPAGKTLTITAGGYVFAGPTTISIETKFVFPPTYDDGTPLQYSSTKKVKTKRKSKRASSKKSDQSVQDSSHSIDSSKDRSGDKGVRENSSEVRVSDSVSPSEGADNGTEGIHG